MSWYPCCCAETENIIVAVFNCNGFTDDNFELKLNGNVIVANMPETDITCGVLGTPCRGHLIRAPGVTWIPPLTIGEPPVECNCNTSPTTWSTYTATELDSCIALTSVPLFRLTSIVDNLCGNFGLFVVYRWNGITGIEIFRDVYNMSPFSFNEYSPSGVC